MAIKSIKICSICGKKVPKQCKGIEYITVGMMNMYSIKKLPEKIVCSSMIDGNMYTDVQGHGVYCYCKVKQKR